MHRIKDYIHNLGESIADCIDAHSSCVDLSCEKDLRKIHLIAEVCEDYNHVCEFCKNFCDHQDGTLYHMDDGLKEGLGLRKH